MSDASDDKASSQPKVPKGFSDDPAPKGKKRLPLWLVIAATAAVGGLYVQDMRQSSRQDLTVVLDTRALIDAKAAEVAALAMGDPQAAQAQTAAFASQLKNAVEEYSSAGYVILNAGYVVKWPESSDITPAIAKKLGVNLALAKKAGGAPAAGEGGPVAAPTAQPEVAPAPAASGQPAAAPAADAAAAPRAGNERP